MARFQRYNYDVTKEHRFLGGFCYFDTGTNSSAKFSDYQT